ncbi:hypothetical protein FOZ62_009008, partial [Perkinsus olseni]
ESMGTLDLYHGYSEEEQMRLAIANSLKENLPKGIIDKLQPRIPARCIRNCTAKELSPRWLGVLRAARPLQSASMNWCFGVFQSSFTELRLCCYSKTLSKPYVQTPSGTRHDVPRHEGSPTVDTAIAGAFDLFCRTLAAAGPCGGMLFEKLPPSE